MIMGGSPGHSGFEMEKTATSSSYSPSLLKNLKDQKAQLEEKLARVNAALDILERNPGVSEALELVSRAVW